MIHFLVFCFLPVTFVGTITFVDVLTSVLSVPLWVGLIAFPNIICNTTHTMYMAVFVTSNILLLELLSER